MKRIVTVVAVLGLAVTACGGGDDDTGEAEETVESVDETVEESAEASASSTADEADPSPTTTADDAVDDDTADDAGDDAADDDGAGSAGGGSIDSLADIPAECRDEMAWFLREIEPIVSSTDWQTATLGDFEEIAAEFESRANEFEERSDAAGCNDLDIDDSGFDLIIELADDEAPGTIGFLEFLDTMSSGVLPDDGAGEDASDSPDGFADCDEAVAFVEDLLANYEAFTEVPAAQLMQFSGLAMVFGTCTPEQLEFFDSPEVNQFLSGE
jgi:hypothetical protein